MSHIKRVSTLWTGLSGLPGTSTLYFHENGDTAADQVTAMVAFWNSLKTYIKSGAVLTVNSVVEVVESDTGLVVGLDDTGAGAAVSGTSAGDRLPPATQALVQWRTGTFFGGRELRGRTFIGALTENENASGLPSSTLTSAITSAAGTLAGVALAVYSPSKHVWASVSSGQAWGEWAVLRSRRD